MSNDDDDDDFSDIDDFDIFDLEAAEAPPESSEPRSSNIAQDSPRPAKRRRLNAGALSNDGHSDLESVSTSSDEDDYLPTTSGEHIRRDTSHAAPSKYKIHVSRGANIQENTFVTQLTQPPSSPSRIRGPRWKKPDPEPPPDPVAQVPGTPPAEESEDEDIRAAIAASLQSCQGESSRTTSSVPSTIPSGAHSTDVDTARNKNKSTSDAELDIWDEDIPDEVFDSLSFPSPDGAPVEEPIFVSSQAIPQQRQNNTQQANLRQTSLF